MSSTSKRLRGGTKGNFNIVRVHTVCIWNKYMHVSIKTDILI